MTWFEQLMGFQEQTPDKVREAIQVDEAAYEATFCAAALHSVRTSNRRVFLTLLGGGAFGNESDWIFAAIERSLKLFSKTNLEVAVVSYSSSNPGVRKLLR